MAGEWRIESQASRTKTDPLAHAKAAREELVSSWDCARDIGSDPWEFAVEIGDLMALGLGRSGLRWLVRKGYAEHAREVIRSGDSLRRFQPELSLAFTKRTCFILTDAGHSLLAAEESAPAVLRLHEKPVAVAAAVPHWDQRMRTLSLGDQIVKRFKVLAGNQEVVLSVFEEEGWTQVIDSPLPPDTEAYPETRLRDTIRRLNSSQENRLLRFYGDGTGCHILWEMVSEVILPLEAARQRARKAA